MLGSFGMSSCGYGCSIWWENMGGQKKIITNNFTHFMFYWLQYEACTYDDPAFVVFKVATDANLGIHVHALL